MDKIYILLEKVKTTVLHSSRDRGYVGKWRMFKEENFAMQSSPGGSWPCLLGSYLPLTVDEAHGLKVQALDCSDMPVWLSSQ